MTRTQATLEMDSKPIEALTPRTPVELLALAIERNLDTDKLRELMALEREWRADKAKAEYDAAMAHFGTLKQVVKHNRTGRTAGNTTFTYADFPAMVKAVTPWLTQCGLSFSHFQDTPTMVEGKISFILVHCRIQHSSGHSQDFDYPAILDDRLAGKMSPSQLIQLAVTYAKRQTLAMGLGLATSEDRSDDDSHSQMGETISKEQVSDLEGLIDEVKADKSGFLRYLGVESLEDIQRSAYTKAVRALESKRKK